MASCADHEARALEILDEHYMAVELTPTDNPRQFEFRGIGMMGTPCEGTIRIDGRGEHDYEEYVECMPDESEDPAIPLEEGLYGPFDHLPEDLATAPAARPTITSGPLHLILHSRTALPDEELDVRVHHVVSDERTEPFLEGRVVAPEPPAAVTMAPPADGWTPGLYRARVETPAGEVFVREFEVSGPEITAPTLLGPFLSEPTVDFFEYAAHPVHASADRVHYLVAVPSWWPETERLGRIQIRRDSGDGTLEVIGDFEMGVREGWWDGAWLDPGPEGFSATRHFISLALGDSEPATLEFQVHPVTTVLPSSAELSGPVNEAGEAVDVRATDATALYFPVTGLRLPAGYPVRTLIGHRFLPEGEIRPIAVGTLPYSNSMERIDIAPGPEGWVAGELIVRVEVGDVALSELVVPIAGARLTAPVLSAPSAAPLAPGDGGSGVLDPAGRAIITWAYPGQEEGPLAIQVTRAGQSVAWEDIGTSAPYGAVDVPAVIFDSDDAYEIRLMLDGEVVVGREWRR